MSELSSARPLIIGHRGASALAPENTMAAFARALRDGADGVEFDVRLARDGVPVIIHDATLFRTAQNRCLVSDLTSHELSQINAGSWFNARHPHAARPEYAQETVPSLKQLFDLAASAAHTLYLEMKSENHEAAALAEAVVRMIGKQSFGSRVIVESFNLSALREVKRLDKTIRTAALFEPRLERPVSLVRRMKTLDLAIQVEADEIALHHSLVTRRLTNAADRAGLPVVVWTVDNQSWLKRALSLGIHALITNDPGRMLSALAAV